MAKGGSKPSGITGRSSKAPKENTGKASERIPCPDVATSSARVSKALQQKCLNVFRDTLNPSADDSGTLQEVKGHLYDRNFASAFGKEEYLRVYASRWSPSRALAYLQVFEGLSDDILATDIPLSANDDEFRFNVVCLGGGAGGELVALAGWLNARMKDSSSPPVKKLDITLVDIADWTQVIAELQTGITAPPVLSRYASQAKKDANMALLETDDISITFKRMDVLDSSQSDLPGLVAKAHLVTFMFTLNELYSASVPKTQHLLSITLGTMRAGSSLLIVDSPGSYSTVTINGAEKKYPMQWLLNYTLVGQSPGTESEKKVKWELLTSDDSRWFRMPEELAYPIGIENMRYQIHLYRRTSDSGG